MYPSIHSILLIEYLMLQELCWDWKQSIVPASRSHSGKKEGQVNPNARSPVVQVHTEALGGPLRGGMSGLNPE